MLLTNSVCVCVLFFTQSLLTDNVRVAVEINATHFVRRILRENDIVCRLYFNIYSNVAIVACYSLIFTLTLTQLYTFTFTFTFTFIFVSCSDIVFKKMKNESQESIDNVLNDSPLELTHFPG
jgi:hypothetical protein